MRGRAPSITQSAASLQTKWKPGANRNLSLYLSKLRFISLPISPLPFSLRTCATAAAALIVLCMQNGTTGSVSGGDTPINPGQDIRLSLLRTGTPDLRPNTTFFLSATLTTGLVPLNNTIVTGGCLAGCVNPGRAGKPLRALSLDSSHHMAGWLSRGGQDP